MRREFQSAVLNLPAGPLHETRQHSAPDAAEESRARRQLPTEIRAGTRRAPYIAREPTGRANPRSRAKAGATRQSNLSPPTELVLAPARFLEEQAHPLGINNNPRRHPSACPA